MTDTKELPLNLFFPCSVKWDDKDKEFKQSTLSEIDKCCIDNCIEPSKLCNDNCIKQHITHRQQLDCLSSCNAKTTLCKTNCSLISSLYSGYDSCAKESGCKHTHGPFFDKDCIKKNKDMIINCCEENCLPFNNTDCKTYCEWRQHSLENIAEDSNFNKNIVNTVNKLSDTKIKNNRYKRIIISIIIISLSSIPIIFLISYIFKKIFNYKKE